MLIKASGARARPNRKPPSHQQLAAAQRAAKATRRRLAAPKKAPLDELGCHHFESCSGCTLNQSLDMPPALQSASEYFQQHGVSYKLDSGPRHHWRHRAKLAVQPGLPGEPARVGLFRQGSHEAVDIPDCVTHHPAINRAVQVLRDCMAACGTDAYDGVTRQGDLRYLQLTVVDGPSGPAATAPTVQLVLVWNSQPDAPSTQRLGKLASRIWGEAGQPGVGSAQSRGSREGLLHSIWANFQPITFGTGTNTILGPDWQLLHGPELAWTRLGGADICLGPGSFLQVNSQGMDRALRVMQGFVPPAAAIVDLHAGVGTIGLSLAATRQPRSVRCVEINPLAEAPFRHSAARLRAGMAAALDGDTSNGSRNASISGSGSGSTSLPQLEYHVAAAGSDPGRWLAGAEVAVVDPPRKGLEPELLHFLASPEALAQHPQLQWLLYLSCGFPALVRDCDALLAGGQWRLAHAEGFMFFPGTNHVETLAVLQRCKE